jgi:hypothetical protein
MKKLIALTIALTAFSSYAFGLGQTWHARGETLKLIGKQVSKTGFVTKTQAVDAAVEMGQDLSSGDMSKAAARAFRTAPILWDHNDKCQSSMGTRFNLVEREMAKGKFEVKTIKVGSYYTGTGQEVFSYTMRFYAPCVVRNRD